MIRGNTGFEIGLILRVNNPARMVRPTSLEVVMPAVLEIDDGAAAWWESPDIWVVPGSDPLGPPGVPSAGRPAYVWARVRNRGTTSVLSARVDFWWANPSAGVTRTLATQFGSAFVDVATGATEEVLCLSPWVPTFVNGGHECLVCEVVSTSIRCRHRRPMRSTRQHFIRSVSGTCPSSRLHRWCSVCRLAPMCARRPGVWS